MNLIVWFSRDRPRMVRLYRVPGEFNTSKMRDSFMRQFVEQGGDPDVMMGSMENKDDIKTTLEHGHFPLIATFRPKCITGPPAQKAGIAHLIRSVYKYK